MFEASQPSPDTHTCGDACFHKLYPEYAPNHNPEMSLVSPRPNMRNSHEASQPSRMFDNEKDEVFGEQQTGTVHVAFKNLRFITMACDDCSFMVATMDRRSYNGRQRESFYTAENGISYVDSLTKEDKLIRVDECCVGGWSGCVEHGRYLLTVELPKALNNLSGAFVRGKIDYARVFLDVLGGWVCKSEAEDCFFLLGFLQNGSLNLARITRGTFRSKWDLIYLPATATLGCGEEVAELVLNELYGVTQAERKMALAGMRQQELAEASRGAVKDVIGRKVAGVGGEVFSLDLRRNNV